MNDKLGRICKDAVVANLSVLLWHLLGGTQQMHKTLMLKSNNKTDFLENGIITTKVITGKLSGLQTESMFSQCE
jgi:hypothetical protein